MFALAFLYLLFVAGLLIHRDQEQEVTPIERTVLTVGLVAIWPVFVGEAAVGILARDRSKPLRPALTRAIVVALFPPYRMGTPDPRTGLVWLPRLGWQVPGKPLQKRLEAAFGGPLLVFAFLILPMLAVEYFWVEEVRSRPALALALHIGVSVIWVGFALEFILESSVAPNPFRYACDRWLDLAIVILPMLEFVLTKWVDAAPIARLLRLGPALSPDQLARHHQLYRLRGMMGKAWQAFLLLGGVHRLFGAKPEKRILQIEAQIADLEEQIAELRQRADNLRATVQSPQTT
jgi:hypothetical protein